MSSAALDYIEREVRAELAAVSPDLPALEYAHLMYAYRFVLARIEAARVIDLADR